MTLNSLTRMLWTASVATATLFLPTSVGVAQERPSSSQSPSVQRDDTQQTLPKPPWSKYMTHRAPRLIALDDRAVQLELFGEAPYNDLDDALRKSRPEVMQLLREYRQSIQRIAMEIRYDALDDVEARRVAAAFSQINQATEERLLEILPAETATRLDQLLLWLRIREQGLVDCLINDFGKDATFAENSLQITTAQHEAWKQQSRQLQRDALAACYEMEVLVAQRLSEQLNSQQKKQLQERLGWNLRGERSRIAERRDNAQSQVSGSDPLSAMDFESPAVSTLALLASLEYESDWLNRNADPGIHRYPWRDFNLPTYDAETIVSGDESVIVQSLEGLEISPAQRQQLNDLAERKAAQIIKWKQRWPDWNDRTSSQRDEFISAYRELEDEQSKQLHRDILLPHQSELLKRYQTTRLARRHGLLPLLADGSLGRELEITQDQRKALFDAAPEIREELISELDELYQQLHDAVLSELDPEQRRRVKQSLGEIPSLRFRGDFMETLRLFRSNVTAHHR